MYDKELVLNLRNAKEILMQSVTCQYSVVTDTLTGVVVGLADKAPMCVKLHQGIIICTKALLLILEVVYFI